MLAEGKTGPFGQKMPLQTLNDAPVTTFENAGHFIQEMLCPD